MKDTPILKINSFAGMGDNGIFYNEGFVARNNSMDEEFKFSELIYTGQFDSDGDLYNFGNIVTGMSVPMLNGAYGYNLLLDATGNLILDDNSLVQTTYKKSKQIGTLGSGATQFPDMALLPDGNIIVSLKESLGLLIRGTVKTGSGTGKIIDTDGRNLVNLGVANAQKVVNIKTGESYTITSITTTTGDNDTLNFTAGEFTNTAGDEFMIIVPVGKGTVNGDTGQNFDLSDDITFWKGQLAEIYFKRQIVEYDDGYYILNGNYLAKLEIISDVYTMETNYKQLPNKAQATAISVNADRILVSAYDENGGMLLYWDGFSDGWNNIIRLENNVNSIATYNNGWLLNTAGILYYTGGGTLEKISEMPDNSPLNNSTYLTTNFKGSLVYNNTYYCSILTDNYNKINPAVYAFDFKTGWSKINLLKQGRLFASPYCLFVEKWFSTSAYSYRGLFVGGNGVFGVINTDRASYTANKSKSFIIEIPLEDEIKVKSIGLNMSYKKNEYVRFLSSGNRHTKISINIGDGKQGVFSQFQVSSHGNNGASINSIYTSIVKKGDELQIMDGVCRGERTYIDNIVDGFITFNPLLTNPNLETTNIRIIKVQEAETKTIDFDKLDEEIMFYFNKAFNSNKLYLEVVVHGIANNFPISINNINIYGN